MPSKKAGFTSGNFRTIILANNVIKIGMQDDAVAYSADDIRMIREQTSNKVGGPPMLVEEIIHKDALYDSESSIYSRAQSHRPSMATTT